jgi:ribosomal protein S18 acetylase RimI-like enzyme
MQSITTTPIPSHIRCTSKKDIPIIRKQEDIVFCEETPLTIQKHNEYIDQHYSFVATVDADSEIVGNIVARIYKDQPRKGMKKSHGWITSIYVLNEYEGSGTSHLLMQKVEDVLHEKGCDYIGLYVRSGNERAIRFYEKRQYVQDGKIEQHYSNGDDALKFYLQF